MIAQLVTTGHQVGCARRPPQGRAKDCNVVDRLPMLSCIPLFEGRTQRGSRPPLICRGEARGKEHHPIAADVPANDQLTRLFLDLFPSQVPANSAISQLPEDILYWTMQVLQVAESSLTAGRRAATRHTTEPGEG
jgi:hypothetical protein